MSGGHFSYKDKDLANEIFGWNLGWQLNYGEEGWTKALDARKANPLKDREISEIVWDVLCLIHSYDYYISGDINYDRYNDDLIHFKNKWLKLTNQQDRTDRYKEDLQAFCDELKKELGGYGC